MVLTAVLRRRHESVFRCAAVTHPAIGGRDTFRYAGRSRNHDPPLTCRSHCHVFSLVMKLDNIYIFDHALPAYLAMAIGLEHIPTHSKMHAIFLVS